MTRYYLVLAVVSVGGFVWLLSRGEPLYAYYSLFLTPVVGVALSRVMIPLLGDAFRQLRRQSLKRWEGLYFEYGSRHLRAVRRGDTLLFFERDILGVLGLKQSRETALFTGEERVTLGRSEGHALTQAGCNRLLRKSAHPDARPLLLHLEREAFAPFARRVENERLDRSPPPPTDSAAASEAPGAQEAGREGDAPPSPNNSASTAR